MSESSLSVMLNRLISLSLIRTFLSNFSVGCKVVVLGKDGASIVDLQSLQVLHYKVIVEIILQDIKTKYR